MNMLARSQIILMWKMLSEFLNKISEAQITMYTQFIRNYIITIFFTVSKEAVRNHITQDIDQM